MDIHLSRIAIAVALAASSATAQTARIAASNTSTTGHGTSVVALGNWGGASSSVYAVANPLDTSGGPQAGSIRIYSGSTNTLIRTVNGQGFATSCAGTPVGDLLGESMAAIDDIDGDGFRELLASRRGASAVVGGCRQAGRGGFMVIFSNPSNPPFVFTATTQLGLGRSVARVDRLGGQSQFVVSNGTGAVQVWRPFTPTNINLFNTVSVFGANGTALCAAGVSASGAARFAVSAPGLVQIRDINGGSASQISPPAGPPPSSSFGSRLAFFADPAAGDCIVIGEPGFQSNSGRVHLALLGGPILQTTLGNSGDALGQSVAAGGDVNADGDLDYIATSQDGSVALVLDRNGNQTPRPITLPTTPVITRATAVAIANDMTADGFADVVLGASQQGQSFVYYGGPDASAVNLGSGCSAVGTTPSIGVLSVPIVGATTFFFMSGGSPNSFSTLFSGVADPVGVPFPGTSCLVHLLSTPAPIGGFSAVTNASGNWLSGPVPIPLALGAQLGFQAVTISNPTGSLEFSDGLNITIGW